MATLSQLILERKKAKEKRVRPLTQEELEENIIDWCDFYRKNWDMYAQYELGMEALHIFQLYILYLMGTSNYFFLMCGRGLGFDYLNIK